MTDQPIPVSLRALRSTDTNTLLRLHDRAAESLKQSQTKQERHRAEKTLAHIDDELRARDVQGAGF